MTGTSSTPRSFRLTDKADALLEAIAAKLGVTKTAVVELAVREFAEKHCVKVDVSCK